MVIMFALVYLFVLLNFTYGVNYYKYERESRSQKNNSGHSGWILTCPRQEDIHPCDCLELDKRFDGAMLDISDVETKVNEPDILSTDSGSGEPESTTPKVPIVEVAERQELHPDMIETVAFCKNIRNVQVLTDAIKGFRGHRINFFVLDGCKLPPFPNNIFKGIGILWMEILNITMQFHEPFFDCAKGCL